MDPGAEFLDEIQKKVLRVFLLAIHSHPLQLWLEISTSSNSRNLSQFLEFSICTLQRRKEENLVENHTHFHMVLEIHTETSNLRTLKIMPRNLNEIVRS